MEAFWKTFLFVRKTILSPQKILINVISNIMNMNLLISVFPGN